VQVKGSLVTKPNTQTTGTGEAGRSAHDAYEMEATALTLVGECDGNTYPMQKKFHSDKFLRSISHLRPRTTTFSAVLRVRNRAFMGLHNFFQSEDFTNVHTPIITPLDCEGGGELFRLESNIEDFFGRRCYLTVSGQLYAEMCASAIKNVYTFGPTFRAEPSNTSHHLAEFWMLEPGVYALLPPLVCHWCPLLPPTTTPTYPRTHTQPRNGFHRPGERHGRV
jgi:asparaginyl-tRNA synthetase